MRLTSYLQDGHLTIELTGEIDHHCAKEYIEAIGAKLEAYNPHTCKLDFGKVTFMDSSGIAVMINTLRMMNRQKGNVMVCGLMDQPLKVFKASGIDKLVQWKEKNHEV